MADEESEVRRMAEIADAINAILEAEPNTVGDTPSQPGAPSAQNDSAQTGPIQAANGMPEAPVNDMAAETAQTAAADDPIANQLDAAIAAEFADSPAGNTTNPSDDPFGPAAALDLPRVEEPNHAIGAEVRPGSEMADLSMRMQDTLAEIRNQSNAAWQGADDLLGEMEAARSALVGDLRGQIAQLEQETQVRRQQIMEQLEALESQSLMVRDEMEIMLVKYEASLTDLHKRYFDNAQGERERLNRYREFLQFLLDERGM